MKREWEIEEDEKKGKQRYSTEESENRWKNMEDMERILWGGYKKTRIRHKLNDGR